MKESITEMKQVNISQEDLDDGALPINYPMPDYTKL